MNKYGLSPMFHQQMYQEKLQRLFFIGKQLCGFPISLLIYKKCTVFSTNQKQKVGNYSHYSKN